EGLEVPSVLSSMAARKFADKLMVSKVGNLVFTLKGRSLALHEMKTNGAALHKQRMLKFKAMYDFFNVENDNIWIQRREPHTMEKILQKKKMLDLIRLMANRSREDNMKLVHMAEDVLEWKEGKDNEKEQSKRHVKLMNTQNYAATAAEVAMTCTPVAAGAGEALHPAVAAVSTLCSPLYLRRECRAPPAAMASASTSCTPYGCSGCDGNGSIAPPAAVASTLCIPCDLANATAMLCTPATAVVPAKWCSLQ
ncbi:hypothetical protein CYMTET_4712, partial [Cymbomonas tetramitiformis]